MMMMTSIVTYQRKRPSDGFLRNSCCAAGVELGTCCRIGALSFPDVDDDIDPYYDHDDYGF